MDVAKELLDFLKRVDESKDTPLKQISDRYLAENNLRAQDAYDAVGISESQYRKLLTGKTGTKERPAEQLRQFLELPEDHWEYVFDSQTCRVRSHQDFNALRNQALGMVAVAPPYATDTASPDLRKLAILGLLIGVGSVLAFSLTGNTFTKSPLPASIPPDRPCIIDLRGEIPEKITCDEFGEFAISL